MGADGFRVIGDIALIVPGYLVCAGVLLYTAIVATVVGVYRRHWRLALSFAAMCLFSAGTAVALAVYYVSNTVLGAVDALRWQFDSGSLMTASLVFFVAHYTGARRMRWAYIGVGAITLVFVAANHWLPLGVRFSEIYSSGWFTLPWGERLFRVQGSPGKWNAGVRVLSLVFMVWAMWRLVRQYRAGQRRAALFLATYLLALYATSIQAAVVDLKTLDTFYWMPFGLLGLSLLMGLGIVMSLAEQRSELLRAQERLDHTLDASNVALFEFEGASGRVLLSDSWSAILGGERAPTDFRIPELFERVHPEEQGVLRKALIKAFGGSCDSCEFELRVRSANGDWKWILTRAKVVRDDSGRVVRIAGTNIDVTDRKRAEQRIHYLATRDALTDLANRALFADRLEHVLRTADAESRRIAVLSVGLDRFTTVNDSLGHRAGDQILKEIADRIARCAGEHDIVARPGGDEFLVLLGRLQGPDDPLRAAAFIRDAVSAPVEIDGHRVVLSASIGISNFPGDGDTAGILLRNAETALHHAKELGGDTVQFFAEPMNAAATARFQMEAALRKGLEHGEFVVHYQPQVAIDSGEVLGYEALLRWSHPELGLVPPGEFLPIAEASGLILELGERVMREACAQAARWAREGARDMRVAVNVTARQFRHPGFVRSVRRALLESGLAPRLLELEIVENAVVDHGPETIATLEALGEMGVELALDDFGTGYSSLSYLRRLPIDTVKIDQSFVADLPASTQSAAIVRAVVSLARGLGLEVVAEGVETQAQADLLLELGCDRAQGYFFARPQPADAIVMTLAPQPLRAMAGS